MAISLFVILYLSFFQASKNEKQEILIDMYIYREIEFFILFEIAMKKEREILRKNVKSIKWKI
jgi:hypothetical protein